MEKEYTEGDGMEYFFNSFANELNKNGVKLSLKQEQMFEVYYDLLLTWNEKMNLTAITDKNEVYEKHFFDSLLLESFYDLRSVTHLLDLGTGAGFPGIPLKIAFPHIEITLLDSLGKRVNFLNEVVKTLDLSNCKLIHGRAEDIAKIKGERESYDLVVSRAVSNLSTLSEYCIPFVRVGGNFIAYKSIHAEDEIENAQNAINILGGNIVDYKQFELPVSKIGRSFVRIDKLEQTDLKYPRRSGKPEKSPLK